MTRASALVIVSGMLVVAACESPTSPPSPKDNAVAFSGRVLDNATGVGVPNAAVDFMQPVYQPPPPVTTDAAGAFTVNVPQAFYLVQVNGVSVGRVRVTGIGSNGDLFVNGGDCGSRYGVISDEATGRPIAGASVSGPLVTDSNGWYRWNSCPDVFDFGTRAIFVSHPDYVAQSIIIGRGYIHVQRLDVALVRK